MKHPELPVGAIIAAALVLVPLPSHWRARNVPTLSLIAWLFAIDIIYAVNSLVWAGNVDEHIFVWCDITTKLIIGSSSALPAATMCICKHLEMVASSRVVRLTNEDHRRRRIFDLVMCLGVPAILMALHYIVQGHRFDIVEDFGCQPATYYSVPAVFIVWFPPLLFSVITLIYAALALRHFFRQRISFASHLQSSNSSLSTNRYLRLMAMSITQMIWGTALTALTMYGNIAPGLRPWTNWADVHSNWNRADLYTLSEFIPAYLHQMFLLWWAIPVSSFIFFLFFGFGEECVNDYKRAYAWVRRVVLRREPKLGSLKGSLPFANSTQRIVVHKSSTVDISPCGTYDDNSLPSYSPPSSTNAFLTLSAAQTKHKSSVPLEKGFITVCLHDPLTPNHAPSDLDEPSTPSSPTSPRIVVSDVYPPSRPPTPPLLSRIMSGSLETVGEVYERPFSPPSVVRIPSNEERALPRGYGDTAAEVQQVVHIRADDMV